MSTFVKSSLLTIALTGLCVSSAAFASSTHLHKGSPNFCRFTDTFYLSGPVGLNVQTFSATGGIKVVKVSSTEFQIQDNGACTKGAATVTVTDNANSNILTINDGPDEMNPSVTSAIPHGLTYTGTEHQWGTYDYQLDFQ